MKSLKEAQSKWLNQTSHLARLIGIWISIQLPYSIGKRIIDGYASLPNMTESQKLEQLENGSVTSRRRMPKTEKVQTQGFPK
ncbi:hypothetical protein BBV17_29105 [Cytobacillus oceanisediminis]|uniref:Uncharacterized protein n=1 Tax=Cytobacillus oceanisediminis TaxID=665099 RepID=A0ABX3CKA2_9BACI|nr:hypothetical protein BBV17_29105 [Cytobacillus oceanisediminis]